MIRGVLFDMDGVLTDTEEFICRAAIEMFREKGLKVSPDDFVPFVGTGENSYLGGVAKKYGLKIDITEAKARTYQIYGKISSGNIKPLPGALDFLGYCRSRGLKTALATSADRVKMEINIRGIGLSLKDFDYTINGLEIERKKPFPDIYLKAAEKTGLSPEECLVVEDALTGIKAGRAAGCRVLAVTTSFKREELKDADWVCDSLENVPEEVLEW